MAAGQRLNVCIYITLVRIGSSPTSPEACLETSWTSLMELSAKIVNDI